MEGKWPKEDQEQMKENFEAMLNMISCNLLYFPMNSPNKPTLRLISYGCCQS